MKLLANLTVGICLCLQYSPIVAQNDLPDVPTVHSQLSKDESGYYFPFRNKKLYEVLETENYSLTQLIGSPAGTDTGIDFDFQGLNGKLMYGFIPYGDSKHPLASIFQIVHPNR